MELIEVKTIRLATTDGPRDIPADVVGPLAVHPLFNNGFVPEKFVITHIPTGLRMGRYWFDSERVALDCARELLDCCPNLTREDPSSATKDRWRRRLTPILRRYAAGLTEITR
jgi:hypothetical protein